VTVEVKSSSQSFSFWKALCMEVLIQRTNFKS